MAKNIWKSNCPLCDRLAGKIEPPGGNILENDFWLVEHSFTPVCMPGLLIAVLKRHCENPAELTPKEVASYYQAITSLSHALKAVFPAKSFRIEPLPDGIAH